jgi:hypothetical protein
MYSSTHFLTSALDGRERLASRPGRFTSRERASGTHWIGSWVGRRAILDAVVKRKIPSLRRESNLRIPIVQPVEPALHRLSYHGSTKSICGNNLTVYKLKIISISSNFIRNLTYTCIYCSLLSSSSLPPPPSRSLFKFCVRFFSPFDY